MSGYGGADDEAERAMIRVEEGIAIAKSLLPSGPGSVTCLDCGNTIPEARRKALPGVVRCVECQSNNHDHKRPKAKEPWAT
jgi:phage/conjugal plasmid C-4 type zinc finger TraR family protein